ncbi:hypothetical protein NPIL_465541, partial [Nephila pilipes]
MSYLLTRTPPLNRSDEICPLCRTSNTDEDRLRNSPELDNLPWDISTSYWEARRRMAEQPQVD